MKYVKYTFEIYLLSIAQHIYSSSMFSKVKFIYSFIYLILHTNYYLSVSNYIIKFENSPYYHWNLITIHI